jgi:hypothetical protein
MFPVMFAIPRTAGWLAQWEEMVNDEEQKIARPRQLYLGGRGRKYVSRDKRGESLVRRQEARAPAAEPSRVPSATSARGTLIGART